MAPGERMRGVPRQQSQLSIAMSAGTGTGSGAGSGDERDSATMGSSTTGSTTWFGLGEAARVFQETVFGVVAVMSKGSQKRYTWVLLESLVVGLQFVLFPLQLFTWEGMGRVADQMRSAIRLIVPFRLANFSYDDFVIVFWTAAALVALCLLNALYVGYAFWRQDFRWMAPLKFLRFAVRYLVSFFYMPLIAIFSSVYNCPLPGKGDARHIYFPNSLICWTGSHVPLLLVALGMSVLFTAFAFLAQLLFFETDYYKEGEEGEREYFSRPHSRYQALFFLNNVALSVIANLQALPRELVALVFFFSGVVLSYLLLQYYPYHRISANLNSTGMVAAFTYGSLLCVLEARYPGLPGLAPAMLAGIVPAYGAGALASWGRFRLRMCTGEAGIVAHVRRPLHVEIAARFVYDAGREDGEAVEVADQLYRLGVERFPTSPAVLMSYAAFCFSVRRPELGFEKVRQAAKLAPPFDLRFLIYRYELERQQKAHAFDIDDARRDLIAHIEYTSNLQGAKKNHRVALRALRKFWSQLSSGDVHLRALEHTLTRIDVAERKAHKHYRFLLNRYPRSPRFLRAYGRFQQEVLCDEGAANLLFEQADMFEDARPAVAASDAAPTAASMRSMRRITGPGPSSSGHATPTAPASWSGAAPPTVAGLMSSAATTIRRQLAVLRRWRGGRLPGEARVAPAGPPATDRGPEQARGPQPEPLETGLGALVPVAAPPESPASPPWVQRNPRARLPPIGTVDDSPRSSLSRLGPVAFEGRPPLAARRLPPVGAVAGTQPQPTDDFFATLKERVVRGALLRAGPPDAGGGESPASETDEGRRVSEASGIAALKGLEAGAGIAGGADLSRSSAGASFPSHRADDGGPRTHPVLSVGVMRGGDSDGDDEAPPAPPKPATLARAAGDRRGSPSILKLVRGESFRVGRPPADRELAAGEGPPGGGAGSGLPQPAGAEGEEAAAVRERKLKRWSKIKRRIQGARDTHSTAIALMRWVVVVVLLAVAALSVTLFAVVDSLAGDFALDIADVGRSGQRATDAAFIALRTQTLHMGGSVWDPTGGMEAASRADIEQAATELEQRHIALFKGGARVPEDTTASVTVRRAYGDAGRFRDEKVQLWQAVLMLVTAARGVARAGVAEMNNGTATEAGAALFFVQENAGDLLYEALVSATSDLDGSAWSAFLKIRVFFIAMFSVVSVLIVALAAGLFRPAVARVRREKAAALALFHDIPRAAVARMARVRRASADGDAPGASAGEGSSDEDSLADLEELADEARAAERRKNRGPETLPPRSGAYELRRRGSHSGGEPQPPEDGGAPAAGGAGEGARPRRRWRGAPAAARAWQAVLRFFGRPDAATIRYSVAFGLVWAVLLVWFLVGLDATSICDGFGSERDTIARISSLPMKIHYHLLEMATAKTGGELERQRAYLTDAVARLQQAHDDLLFGNASRHLDGALHRYQPVDDLLFGSGCFAATEGACVAGGKDFAEGLESLLLRFVDAVRQLASPEEASKVTRANPHMQLVTRVNVPGLQPGVRRLADLFSQEAGLQLDRLHVVQSVCFAAVVLLLVLEYFAIFARIIASLQDETHRTSFMILMLPPEVIEATPSIKTHLASMIARLAAQGL